MIINIIGDAFNFEGRDFIVGETVIGTKESEYFGLIGTITEIREGEDKDTENETPDIYCAFDMPELQCEVKRFEEIFSDLYEEPKEIGDIIFDEVIMAPDMILPLSAIGKHPYASSVSISEFRGKYQFLSNLYNADIQYKGLTYKNNEAAFQAMKSPVQAQRFIALDGVSAKRAGRLVSLREDWELVKEEIMYEICLAKFSQNRELKAKLLATQGKLLIEGNSWGDTEWGICDGCGQNKLGTILMCIREELR